MSFGSLSGPAVEALNRGAQIAGCLHNTGEGGVSPYHLNGGDLVWQIGTGYFGCREADGRFSMARLQEAVARSGRPGSLLTLAPHRSGRAGSAASGSSTDGFATRRRVPAGPGSQAMATAIPKAYLASSAIRCRDVETGPNLGVLAVFPSTGATCRCPLPSTGSRGLNSPASAVL